VEYKHTSDGGMHCWFFVQTDEGQPWPLDPEAFVVTVLNPDYTKVFRPTVQALAQTGMFGFDVKAAFLDQPGEYVAVIATDGLPIPAFRRTFHVVHQNN
jgi:hypothetical protein